MKKIHISLPDNVYKTIMKEAKSKKVSFSEIIREKIGQTNQKTQNNQKNLRDLVIEKYSDIIPGLKDNLIGAILIDVDTDKLFSMLKCDNLVEDTEEEE